jgi:hypothetical protein
MEHLPIFIPQPAEEPKNEEPANPVFDRIGEGKFTAALHQVSLLEYAEAQNQRPKIVEAIFSEMLNRLQAEDAGAKEELRKILDNAVVNQLN